MIDGLRKVRQRCDICNAEAMYCAGAVVVIGQVPEHGLIIAQCPQCERFVCSEHASRATCQLAPEAMEICHKLIQDTDFPPTVLCCPLHGVPLGQFRDCYVIVGNLSYRVGETSQRSAREYVKALKCNIHNHTGFDFSQRRLASPEAIAWPFKDGDQSSLLERIKAAQSTRIFKRNTDPNPL